MYYHFAFLAISIALFGLSASGVFAYVARRRLDRYPTDALLARAVARSTRSCTIVALFCLVRLRVGLNYSPRNLALMLDDLRARRAALLHRRPRRHAGDLAAVGADQRRLRRRSDRRRGRLPRADPAARSAGRAGRRARGRGAVDRGGRAVRAARAQRAGDRRHRRRRSSLVPRRRPALRHRRLRRRRHQRAPGRSRALQQVELVLAVGVYERAHGDWSLSPAYTGPLPDTRFMDIDSAASTPILRRRRRDLVERAVPALRADGAGLPPRSERRPTAGLHRARHRTGRRARPRRRRSSSAPRTSTASRSTRSSPTT